ncbi:MAG: DNA polymerase III subunit [Candidatus Omnitrophica bacterium]|nr:DNA polymerase III subunit [Candidatus Omnitrophota bacterium]
MKKFENHPPVHTAILERFYRLKSSKRLAHAYLFIGPKGIGKSETALAVARLLNCEKETPVGEACDCPSCRKIDCGNHPDMYRIKRPEDKSTIPVELFRDVIERLQLRPIEARVRVCLVEDVDEVRAEAGNVFLKTLEEPRADTLLILTTSVPEAVLKTVVSRCHQVFFFPLSDRELADWLQIEYHESSSEAGEAAKAVILAKLSRGSPGRAKDLGLEFLQEKNEIIDCFILSPRLEDAFLKSYTSDKETARKFLEVLLTFFRDVALVKRGLGEAALIHADRAGDLKKLASRYTEADLAGIVAEIVSAMRGIKENMNVKVAVTLLKEMI